MKRPGRFSTVLLGILAALSFLTLAFALARTGADPGDARTALLYYAGPALAGVLLLAATRLPAGARQALAATLLAGIAGVYGAEAYLALSPPAAGGAGPPPPGYDTRTVAAVIDDFAAAGTVAYPVVFGAALLEPDGTGALASRVRIDGAEVLPLAGIADAVTVYCNEGGEYLVYPSDRHGFHNPAGAWQGDTAIAALGDSFTQGACVASADGLVGRIRAARPGTLNLGLGGNGPLMMLAGLKEYMPARSPPIVLWLYFEGNDLAKDLFRERRSALLMRYLEPGFRQGLATMQPAIDDALVAVVAEARAAVAEPAAAAGEGGPGLLDILLLRHLRHALGLAAGRADMGLFRRVLEEARGTVSGWGGALYFVYLPDQRRYRGMAARLEQDSLRRRVLALVAELGLPLIDLEPVFSAQSEPEALFQGHYDEAGHALVARTILDKLATNTP